MVTKSCLGFFGRACIPQRYVLGIMGLLGMANAYIMRSCLSIAITAMVKYSTNDTGVINEEECPASDYSGNSTQLGSSTQGTYDWDEKTQGVILSAFYYGYIITHVPGGMLAERFGGKHTLGLGIFSTAIFTLLTPLAAQTLGAWGLVGLRFLMGLGEGTTFPALSTLLAAWAPPLEKSKLSSLCFAGVQLGMIIATSCGAVIINYWNWESVFYVFGVVGIIWFVLWCLLCYSDPESHPYITEEEKNYLAETIGSTKRDKDLDSTPWTALLTSAAVWALIIGEIGHDWGLYTMITDLPKYMSDVMHFKIAENGVVSTLPYLVMWLTSLAIGAVADWILARGYMTITPLRKVLATVGAIGPGLGVILASYAGCNKLFVTILFTIGMGLMGFCYASLRVNSLDLSPNYAGSIMALQNGLSSVSGMVTPYLIGILTPNRTLKEWRVVFWIMFATLFLTNCVFVVWGSGDVQVWNSPRHPRPVELNGKPSHDPEKHNHEKTSDTTAMP